MSRLDVARFLEDLSGKHAKAYTEALRDMLVAIARNNRRGLEAARKRLAEVQAETMGMGEVLGASLVLQKAAPVIARELFGNVFGSHAQHQWELSRRLGFENVLLTFASEPTQSILPRVTLVEALEDMVERTPTTIRNAAERTAQNIARLYGEASGGIPRVAFVRSAEQAVTERVQSLIVQAIAEGIPEAETGTLIRMSVQEIGKRTADWTESYARMVFRTNLNTAVTAGRFRQAQDPDIQAVVPAFRFDAVMDGDTRSNHAAGNGVIMRVSNPLWNRYATPLGFS